MYVIMCVWGVIHSRILEALHFCVKRKLNLVLSFLPCICRFFLSVFFYYVNKYQLRNIVSFQSDILNETVIIFAKDLMELTI